jgi:hypothetical protein
MSRMKPTKITRFCPFTLNQNTMEITLNESDLERYYEGGVMIQDAFPYLTPGEREFIKSGITPDMWIEIFGNSEEN